MPQAAHAPGSLAEQGGGDAQQEPGQRALASSRWSASATPEDEIDAPCAAVDCARDGPGLQAAPAAAQQATRMR
jgi:hypothetical protein